MLTVKELKDELNKFPENALCCPHEGGFIGITITKEGDVCPTGFIHCSPYPGGKYNETQVLK